VFGFVKKWIIFLKAPIRWIEWITEE